MNFREKFYEYLRTHKGVRGWQADLVKLSGISQSSLSKIITGETKDPGIDSVGKIIDAIGDEFVETLLSYTPSQSETAKSLRERISSLERENELLRELVDTLKENRALEKNAGARELPSGSGRLELPSVEE